MGESLNALGRAFGRRLGVALAWTGLAVAVCGLVASAARGTPGTSATPPINFSAPAVLPKGTIGKPYEFSFCRPKPRRAGRCGAPSGATSPSGGFGQYYVFELRLSVLPAGLLLSHRTGILFGTPKTSLKPGVYRFQVCVRDADKRRPRPAAPTCRRTRLELVAPAPPPVVSFVGTWNGTFSAALSANACGSAANGTVRFNLSQQDTSVTGTASYTITGGTLKPNPPTDCENLDLTGTLPVSGTVTGSTLTGSGFTLTKTSDTALSGKFEGTVEGIGVNATVNATK